MDIDRNKGEAVRYSDGQVVFREGDEGRHLYVVLSGSVQIRKEGATFGSSLGRCVEGDCFGEMAVVDAQPRSATAIAMGDTELLRFDRAAFFDAVRAQPELAVQLLASVSSKLRRTNEELQNVRAAYLRNRAVADVRAQD